MKITPEEEFNQEVWEVLQKIRKAKLATVGENIEFRFPTFVGGGIIPKGKQKKILYKLQEWKALKIRENPWEPPESTPHLFYLNLTQPKFNKIYKNFHKTCNADSRRDKLQKKTPDKKREEQIMCCGLIYSHLTNQLIFTGGERTISPETREMKFFLTLYRKKGQTVDYKTIAKEASLQSYKNLSGNGEIAHEDLLNKDFSEDASLLRRDFRNLVLPLGMSTDEFSKMIKTIKKHGYQLNCK